MKHRYTLILCLSTFALAGCATVYEERYDFADGWREAKVIQIAHASEIPKPQFSDCRDAASPQQLATDKFIVLSYRHLNRPRKRVVPLSPSAGVRMDELVYMNVTGCDRPLQARSNPSARPRLE